MNAGDPGSPIWAFSRRYRLMLSCIRASWVACSIGVMAMLPALALRLPSMVVVYESGLVIGLTALGCALVLFVVLVLAPAFDVWATSDGSAPPVSLGGRTDLLVAHLLADLLDPD